MRASLLLTSFLLATAGTLAPARADDRAPLPEALQTLLQEERFAPRVKIHDAYSHPDAYHLDIRPGNRRVPGEPLDANEIGRLIKGLDGVKLAELNYSADPAQLPLLGKLPGIESLSVRTTADGIDAALCELLPMLPDVNHFHIEAHRLGNSGLEAISRHPKIRWLIISSQSFDDAGVRHLGNMRQLQALHCNDLLSGHISDAIFLAIGELSQLEDLSVGGKGITGSELGRLAPLRNLNSLSLQGTGVTDESLRNLAGCRQLRHLDLVSTGITDRGLAELAPLAELRYLRLEKVPITDRGLAALAPLEQLRGLTLDNAPITDDAIPNLAQLPNLEALNVGETDLTDVACGRMSKLPKLKSLRLSFTYVTDAGVAALADCKQLEDLQLHNCILTDRCVADLCKLKSLTSLYVNQTDITPGGVQALRDGLGEHCEIHSGGMRDPDRRGPWVHPAFRTRRLR